MSSCIRAAIAAAWPRRGCTAGATRKPAHGAMAASMANLEKETMRESAAQPAQGGGAIFIRKM